MIYTNQPQSEPSDELCKYLLNDLRITEEALELGIRQSKLENAPLPIVLRSFGLLTIDQFQEVLNWQNQK